MELIDKKKLILELNNYRLKILLKFQEKDCDSYYGGMLLAIQEIISKIDKQPTAYDIDAVTNYLKNRKDESAAEKLNAIDNDENTISMIYCSREAAYKDAIEIVKGKRNIYENS